jgi:hypothetical protein
MQLTPTPPLSTQGLSSLHRESPTRGQNLLDRFAPTATHLSTVRCIARWFERVRTLTVLCEVAGLWLFVYRMPRKPKPSWKQPILRSRYFEQGNRLLCNHAKRSNASGSDGFVIL